MRRKMGRDGSVRLFVREKGWRKTGGGVISYSLGTRRQRGQKTSSAFPNDALGVIVPHPTRLEILAVFAAEKIPGSLRERVSDQRFSARRFALPSLVST